MSPVSNWNIATSDSEKIKYTLNIGGTEITTEDIDFIKALRSVDDSATVLTQIVQEFKDQTLLNIKDGMAASIKEKVKELEKENEVNITKNFNFGPCSDRAKISHLGIAVLNSNNEWVSYDKENGEIVNVDLVNFGCNDFVYMIPVAIKDVAVGDAIIHNHHVMFVTRVKDKNLSVIDVTDGEVKKILPTKSVFGFNFITKLVSLIDFSASTASEDNPFGDMLPFLLLGNSDNKGSDMLPLVFMLMNKDGKDGGFFSSSTSSTQMMLMAMMMGNGKQNRDMQNLLPLMFLTNGNTKTAIS